MTGLYPQTLEEGLVLNVCLEPLELKGQRGGLTWSSFPFREPTIGEVGWAVLWLGVAAGQGEMGLASQSSPSS